MHRMSDRYQSLTSPLCSLGLYVLFCLHRKVRLACKLDCEKKFLSPLSLSQEMNACLFLRLPHEDANDESLPLSDTDYDTQGSSQL